MAKGGTAIRRKKAIKRKMGLGLTYFTETTRQQRLQRRVCTDIVRTGKHTLGQEEKELTWWAHALIRQRSNEDVEIMFHLLC